eukprot:g2314.t1
MELLENPLVAGTAAATMLTPLLDRPTSGPAKPNTRVNTCVGRLTAWLDKLRGQHPRLYIAVLAAHALVSGALFGADVGTDAVATADIRAQPGHPAWLWKLMAAFIAFPIAVMWLGLVQLVWKKRDNGYGERSAEDFEEARNLYGPTLLVIIFGLPAVPLLDVLMLLLKVPGIADALRARLPNDSHSSVTRSFMITYSAARTLVETFLESLPQLIIQISIAATYGNGADVELLLPSITLSFFDFAWVFGNNVFTARKRNRSLWQQFSLLLRIGGGALENALEVIYGNAITFVDLDGLDIGVEGAEAVADALKFNRSLKRITLMSNNIGDDGTAALSEALKSNSTLESLELNTNDIKPAGAQSLADMLHANRSLTVLDVSGNDIGDAGKIAIGDTLLRISTSKLQFLTCTEWSIEADTSSLELRGKGLNVADAKLLAGVIKFNRALTALDVRGNALGDGKAALAEVVSKSQQIVTFCDVPVKQMRDDALMELDLTGKGIGACGAMVVAHLLEFSRALKSADFSANSIGGEGTVALSNALTANSTLEALELRSNKVGAAGAQSLAGMLQVNRSLTALDVGGNAIGDDGKSAIGDALLSSSTSRLQFLTCSEWSIKADTSSLTLHGKRLNAADAKLLAGVIKFNRALTSLDLYNNEIGAGGAEAIAAALPQS